MRLVRSILAALLIASLAATPAVAKAATVVNDPPPAADQGAPHHGHMAGMPDCHGMAQKSQQSDHADRAQHKPGSHEKCPACDKQKPCSADICQLKCFKVLGALSERAHAADVQVEHYASAPPRASAPVSWKPRTPPPRN